MMTAETIHKKLCCGLSKFFSENGKSTAVIGLSGGIDSSLVAALAVETLGSDNVSGLIMPSQHSTVHSVTDAVQLAENLGITVHLTPIESIYNAFIKELTPVFGHHKTPDVTEENLQARIRAVLLMAVSNKYGSLALNTSNKSELAMGYGTLYGDLIGALMVIGDVYKTQVYEVARYINRHHEIIPKNTLSKEPSAELHPGQKDSDSIPPYDVLDPILHGLVEERQSPAALVEQGFEETLVTRIVQQKARVAFKGYQLPPLLAVGEHPLLPEDKCFS
ncbi:MAG: NAD(+) synthase [Prevotellaceae bacterium]|jgi:NAD+ synthase (glutamine-hydrolysing)|nr:NAD(+) synthase [Prevotellaceae bacterium]